MLLGLISGGVPWIGVRTNRLDGEHVELLRDLANPIGIKIGPDSDAAHIAGLQEKLNPDNVPGKLTFMIRIPVDKIAAMQQVVDAIAEHAPDSNVLYDIHEVTKTNKDAPPGLQKIRAVEDIVAGVERLANHLHVRGLRLHGVHLETIMDDSRRECVETADQVPTHPGGVDPQLSPKQLEQVIEGIKPHLLRPTPKELYAQRKGNSLASNDWSAVMIGTVR